HGGAVGPAAEPGVSRPPVEERLGRALRDRLLPVGPGGLGVVAEVVTVDRPGQHHAVVVQRGPLGDLVPQHVADHELRITFQWVAPPAAAGGADPDRLAGPYRLGVGERADLALVLTAWVDHDLERRAGFAALHAPARQ